MWRLGFAFGALAFFYVCIAQPISYGSVRCFKNTEEILFEKTFGAFRCKVLVNKQVYFRAVKSKECDDFVIRRAKVLIESGYVCVG